MNTVYWITGLSSSGKTTIGSALYYKLKEENRNVVILDGDILKDILGNCNYSNEERLKRAFIYARMCKMLSDQGIEVICCSISMFDEVRKWNRENIENYYEIFLDVPMEILMIRDNKNLYTKFKKGLEKEVVGVGDHTEFPKTPDLTIENDGSKPVYECVDMILNHRKKEKRISLSAHTEYWDGFYQKRIAVEEPSYFAKSITEYMEKGKTLLDLGCGNGRDSLYFERLGLKVTAIDASSSAIKTLKHKSQNTMCICDDFVKASIVYQKQYDYCYSRFSIHSIDEKQQSRLLINVFNALKNNGKFFIEVRSVKDSIYGKGKYIERNAYLYEEHYRRFIVMEELVQELKDVGFHIIYNQEQIGFAPFKEENPPVIRIIAGKA